MFPYFQSVFLFSLSIHLVFSAPGGTVISHDPADIHFYAFSKTIDRSAGQEIDAGDAVSMEEAGLVRGRDLVVVIHGFADHYNSTDSIKGLIDAYVDNAKTPMNVVSVDWNKLTASIFEYPLNFASYFETLQNVPVVAKSVAEFINKMTNWGIPGPSGVHLVGHSLGTHVAGATGSRAQKLFGGQKLARITGLDVAGPFKNLLAPKDQLLKDKAEFVDTVHSDIFLFGTRDPVGHLDFFANGGGGGSNQPGCKDIPNILNSTALFCAHTSAIRYFVNSIVHQEAPKYGCRCAGVAPCSKSSNPCKDRQLFGEYDSSSARGLYYVKLP